MRTRTKAICESMRWWWWVRVEVAGHPHPFTTCLALLFREVLPDNNSGVSNNATSAPVPSNPGLRDSAFSSEWSEGVGGGSLPHTSLPCGVFDYYHPPLMLPTPELLCFRHSAFCPPS